MLCAANTCHCLFQNGSFIVGSRILQEKSSFESVSLVVFRFHMQYRREDRRKQIFYIQFRIECIQESNTRIVDYVFRAKLSQPTTYSSRTRATTTAATTTKRSTSSIEYIKANRPTERDARKQARHSSNLTNSRIGFQTAHKSIARLFISFALSPSSSHASTTHIHVH